MERLLSLLLVLLAVAGCAGERPAASSEGSEAGRFIAVTEQAKQRILILDAEREWSEDEAVAWSWSPARDPQVDVAHEEWFSNPTDVKGYDGGRQMLVSASGGGVALIDVAQATVQYYAYAGGNTHSIERLPDGNIVSASSTGNYVSLFVTGAEGAHDPAHPARTDYPLADAHGVYWDEARERLWALGSKQMKAYAYASEGGVPALKEEAVVDLPVTPESRQYERHGGHDLAPRPGGDEVFVTDMDHVWVFDPAARAFEPLDGPHETAMAKSISQAVPGGPVIIMQATESWWSDTIRQWHPSHAWTMPGARFYKARWWPYRLDAP